MCKWLHRIACNVAFNHARDERLDVSIESDGGGRAEVLQTSEPEPLAALSQAEVQQALTDVIGRLPPELRAVFILRDVERLSTIETANALTTGDGLVKWRLHHARRRLRDQLSEHRPDEAH